MSDRYRRYPGVGTHVATWESAGREMHRRDVAAERARQEQLEAQAAMERQEFEQQKYRDEQAYRQRLMEQNEKRWAAEQRARADAAAEDLRRYEEGKAFREKAQTTAVKEPKPFHSTVLPEDEIEMLGDFGKYYDTSTLKPRQAEAILNLQNRGVPYGKIAATVGLIPKEVVVEDSPLWFRDKKAPDPSAGSRTWYRANQGVTGVDAQPEAAPQVAQRQPDTPEVAQAKWLIAEFQRREKAQPGWSMTLSNEAADKLEAALDLVEGVQQTRQAAPGVTEQRPAGRIVPDEQLQDMNSDGKRDQADAAIMAQVQNATAIITGIDSLRKQGVKIDPELETQYKLADVFVNRYKKFQGDRFTESFKRAGLQ